MTPGGYWHWRVVYAAQNPSFYTWISYTRLLKWLRHKSVLNWPPKSSSPEPFFSVLRRLLFSSAGGGGVPNSQKVSVNIIATPPLWWQPKFTTPPPPIHLFSSKQAKIVLKSVFLNKINTLWSSCAYIVVINNFMTSLFFFSFQKFMIPQYIWAPLPMKMTAPKLNIFRTKLKFYKKNHIFSSRSSNFLQFKLYV